MGVMPARRGAQGPGAALVVATAVLGAAALALGAVVLALAPDATRLPAGGRAVPVLGVAVAWGFVGAGVYAWLRRPDNATGALLLAFGLCVLVSLLYLADAALPYLASTFADPLAVAVFVHLLLAFPTGRTVGRTSRVVVAATYAAALAPQVVVALFDPDLGDDGCADCPRKLLLVADESLLAAAAGTLQQVAGVVLVATALVLLVRRWRAARGVHRSAFAPVLLAGGTVLALGIVSASAQDSGLDGAAPKVAQLVFVAAFAALPAAFLLGLVRARVFRAASVRRLLDRLTGERPNGVGSAVAAALGDPTATVAHWLPEAGAYVDGEGRPVMLPPPGNGVAVTEIAHQGRRLGVLVHDPGLEEDPELLRTAVGAAALALENDRLEVELRARLEALRASRARIVEAGDAERRRLGRDLHDGAQQRLISLLLSLQLVQERLDDDPGARALVADALTTARAAVDELRDLASGIHPAVLSQRGLDAAVETLAARAPVPVELDVRLDGRLPAAVETAAYFVVSEALANAAKHADATHARVGVRRDVGGAVVEVADDGAGGASLDGGSGLGGLADRVGALDGTLEIASPRGGGTILRARFPLR